MTFEQLLRTKLQNDMIKLYGPSLQVRNDFYFNADTNNPVMIINTTAGSPVALQGIEAVNVPLSIELYCDHTTRDNWLDNLKHYIMGLNGVPTNLDKYTCVFALDLPSIPDTPFNRNDNKWVRLTITGSCIYTDSIDTGSGLEVYIGNLKLNNIIRCSLSNAIRTDDILQSGVFNVVPLVNSKAFTLTITVLISQRDSLHGQLQYATNFSDPNYFTKEIKLTSGINAAYSFDAIIQTMTTSIETGAFSTMEITLTKVGD